MRSGTEAMYDLADMTPAERAAVRVIMFDRAYVSEVVERLGEVHGERYLDDKEEYALPEFVENMSAEDLGDVLRSVSGVVAEEVARDEFFGRVEDAVFEAVGKAWNLKEAREASRKDKEGSHA